MWEVCAILIHCRPFGPIIVTFRDMEGKWTHQLRNAMRVESVDFQYLNNSTVNRKPEIEHVNSFIIWQLRRTIIFYPWLDSLFRPRCMREKRNVWRVPSGCRGPRKLVRRRIPITLAPCNRRYEREHGIMVITNATTPRWSIPMEFEGYVDWSLVDRERRTFYYPEIIEGRDPRVL